jgi:hypothetical protein
LVDGKLVSPQGNFEGSKAARGAWNQSARTKSNGFDLAVLAPGVKLLAVESKGDAGGVSGLDDDFLPAADGALAAGFQKFGRG